MTASPHGPHEKCCFRCFQRIQTCVNLGQWRFCCILQGSLHGSKVFHFAHVQPSQGKQSFHLTRICESAVSLEKFGNDSICIISYHIHLVSSMYSSFSSSPPYPALQILQHKPLAALATPINRRTLIAVTIRTTKFSNSHLVHSWWRQGTSHSLLFEFRQIDLASFRALTASAFTGRFS